MRHYVFAGMAVALRRGGDFYFLHGDHLGSIVVQTDEYGNGSPGVKTFQAYGAENSGGPTFATDRNFTGQKRDGTNLLYYNARYYDPTLGIFLSPDTIVPEPTLTVDYNRFQYARANPLRFRDPTGHAPQNPDDDPDNPAPCGSDWCWKNRWYRAHGYGWDGEGWSISMAALFYDAGILSDVLGEAGVVLADGWNWGTHQRQMSAIGQGVVAFGKKLTRGLPGLKGLLGGGAKLHHVAATPPICLGAKACALSPDLQSVYFSTAFLSSDSDWIAQTTVHELAHVIDWHSRIYVGGLRRTFSVAWMNHVPLTEYAQRNHWENWAEAVTMYVFGTDYADYTKEGIRPEAFNIQMARIAELLNGAR